jgi:MFS transporter, Spinster family, sphingosine-1-phosphate transporter
MSKHRPLIALLVLSGLNFFNYVDRYVLPAVLLQIKAEFPNSSAAYGFLTTVFFLCYMVTAPFVGYLADRFNRKWLMVIGAVIWSGATLLTAVTHSFETLLIRHTVVGIGEATFVTIAPSFLSDLYSEEYRGRVFGWFYLNIGLGAAAGYAMGGILGHAHGWRFPFYIAALPGFLLALILCFLPEPVRGAKDRLLQTSERTSLRGLIHNGAFWTATLGMAMVTYALGGLSNWMPAFLESVRGVPQDKAGLIFGGITAVGTVTGTFVGGWMGDKLLTRTKGAYYFVSAATLVCGILPMIAAIYVSGPLMFPSMALALFVLFLNTAPLNAAVVNSVGASIRATAIAVNLFTIHLLGDASSPWIIGKIADATGSLQTGFLSTIAAIVVAAVILFYGMKFAPQIPSGAQSRGEAV